MSTSATTNLNRREADGFVFKTKAMVKQAERRRSSLSLRGAKTSLALHGTPVPPHASIHPSTYYAHMQADSPDPIKMKTLLVWVILYLKGEHVPSRKFKLSEAERVFKDVFEQVTQSVLDGLVQKTLPISWYHRPPEEAEGSKVSTTGPIPHPQNVINAQAFKEKLAILAALEEEEAIWDGLAAVGPQLPTPSGRHERMGFPSIQQRSISAIANLEEFESWMRATYSDMKINMDELCHLLAQIVSLRLASDQQAQHVFKSLLQPPSKNTVDPMDILRLLSKTTAM